VGVHKTESSPDKGYDTQDCVADMRERRVTPHIAQNTSMWRSAIDGRTTRHSTCAVSQRIRKRVEIVRSQVTKPGVQAGLGRRDHVPYLDFAIGGNHAID
jgi:hypothetical protein